MIKKYFFMGVLFFTCITTSLFSQSTSKKTVATIEYEALVDFYNAMNGKKWSNKWDVSTNNLHEGAWFGLSLDGGHIVSISLPYNNLLGSIPKSFSNLKYLRSLNLKACGSSDYFPTIGLDNLSGLERLESLNLSRCDLTEEIPSSWSKLRNLKKLYLGYNNLTGSISKGIGELKNLERLSLFGNKFTSIPSAFSNLLKLKYLDLGNNKFTSIPSTIYSLLKLEYLYLEKNKLTGDLPKGLESLTSLRVLDVSDNNLTGINAFLPIRVLLKLHGQEYMLPELVYKGEDVIVSALPKILKYNRDKNDFSCKPLLFVYVKAYHDVGPVKINSNEEIVIPKEYFLSLGKRKRICVRESSPSGFFIYFKKVTIDLPNVSKTEKEDLVDFNNAKNYPNPFKEKTTIQFYLKEKEQQVTLLFFDMTGRKVFVENIPAVLGVNNYTFNRKKLPSGIYNYIIELKNNGKKLKGKMIIE